MDCGVIFIEWITNHMSLLNSFEDHNTDATPEELHYMFIDTETTGVPKNGYTDWSQCRLIQLGILVMNRNFEVMHEECTTIEFDGTNSSIPEAIAIHGITDEDRRDATPGICACRQFLNLAMKCSVLVSHGNAFDFGAIFRECLLHELDISCLIGKTIVNTKQSEHYRGFKENLQQTVKRLNPNWVYESDGDTDHPHNALYDAYLCAELFKHSHRPAMYRPAQDLIEYLNFRKYSADINDLRAKIESVKSFSMTDITEEEEEDMTDSLMMNEYADDDYSSNYSYKEDTYSDYLTMEDYLRFPHRFSDELYYHAPEDYTENS